MHITAVLGLIHDKLNVYDEIIISKTKI